MSAPDRLTRRSLLASSAAVVVLATGGVAIAGSSQTPSEPSDSTPPADQTTQLSNSEGVAGVERRTLTREKEFNVTVSYGSDYQLPITASGTITRAPERNQVIEPGEEIMRIDDKPVFLASGTMPLYREMKRTPDVAVKGQKYMRGYDIGHLQQFLIAAGFDDDAKMTVSGDFDPATERAVKAWQRSVGLAPTGRVDRSQLVTQPEAFRVNADLRPGSNFDGLTVTSTDQELTFNVATRDRSLVTIGGSVGIAAADGATVTGEVTKLERSIDEQGQSVVAATVRPDQPLPADATSAVVTATDVLATDVLAVPVRALLAVRQGGMAVELAAPGPDGGGRLVAVEVGDVADGWAEITGDIEVGEQVVTAQ